MKRWVARGVFPSLSSLVVVGFSFGCGDEGVHVQKSDNQSSLPVIGGTEATPGEYPWQAQLQVPNYSHWCGGSLLNTRWVLTAAHCVEGFVNQPGNVTVTMGEHNLSVYEGREQIRSARRIVIHPRWNSGNITNDVALVELQSAVTVTAWVQPIPLASNSHSPGVNTVITGWGNTAPGSGASNVLMEAPLPLVDNATCDAHPDLSLELTDSMVCAGYGGGDSGGCHGDSGGPLVRYTSTGGWEQLGIVSWGQGYWCSTYTVFSRVNHFTSWVDSIIEGATNPCVGSTEPESTEWKQYGSSGLYVDIDTSACGYGATPQYFSSMGGVSHHWYTTGGTSIYSPTATGFRVYVYDNHGPITPAVANARGWYINWNALPQNTRQTDLCIGSTPSGSTAWLQYGDQGLYVDVDTSACGFTGVPEYFTSFGGSSHHWFTSGITSIYAPTATGFRVYVYDNHGSITPAVANARGWRVNWQAKQSGGGRFCVGQTSETATAWQQYGTQGLYVDVSAPCALTGTPEFFTSFGGSSHHWYTYGITSIYRPTATGFRIYVYDRHGAVTPAVANSRRWHVNWTVRR